MALTGDKQLIYNLPQSSCFQNLMQYVSCHIYQAQILCHTVLHVYNSYMHIYIITQVILAFAYDLLEDRCTIDVIITEFLPLPF